MEMLKVGGERATRVTTKKRIEKAQKEDHQNLGSIRNCRPFFFDSFPVAIQPLPV
jgi:hypothetical protein